MYEYSIWYFDILFSTISDSNPSTNFLDIFRSLDRKTLFISCDQMIEENYIKELYIYINSFAHLEHQRKSNWSPVEWWCSHRHHWDNSPRHDQPRTDPPRSGGRTCSPPMKRWPELNGQEHHGASPRPLQICRWDPSTSRGNPRAGHGGRRGVTVTNPRLEERGSKSAEGVLEVCWIWSWGGGGGGGGCDGPELQWLEAGEVRRGGTWCVKWFTW